MRPLKPDAPAISVFAILPGALRHRIKAILRGAVLASGNVSHDKSGHRGGVIISDATGLAKTAPVACIAVNNRLGFVIAVELIHDAGQGAIMQIGAGGCHRRVFRLPGMIAATRG